jgi:hypothetical protein
MTIDRVSTKLELNALSDRAPARGYPGCPMAVATEVLLLRRPDVRETRLWPMLVMVVTEPADRDSSSARPLFELLDRPKHVNELSIVAAESAWSVLDPASALLTLTVRATVPVSFDLTILLPAAPVLDILDVAARGTAIGVTTQDHANRLRGRVDIRTVLRDVVLLTCPPSTDLADLAAALRSARKGEAEW